MPSLELAWKIPAALFVIFAAIYWFDGKQEKANGFLLLAVLTLLVSAR